jgi:Novel STAND NTPase 1
MAPPDDTAKSSTVDVQHPWLGLDSFTEDTQRFFYGREEEVAELGRRVQRKLLTILFGQSGLGKTSILRAGIVPRLRPMGYCPVYVRIDYSPESPSPSEQIKDAIFRATQASGQWTQPGTAVQGESLWEFLHHRDDVLRDSSGKTLIPLLIFDQFEEIFTLAQSDDFGRKRAAEFIDDLADLVENRPPKALEARIDADESAAERFDFTRSDYRILIALREDYLAHLEGVKGVMPSITQNRMRLARMTGAQALEAVLKPGGKLVSQEVAESIVRFIAGGSELPNAEVEPSLLSLICRELNNARIAQGRAEISADLLAGSRDTILTEFYERALSDQPAGVRKFIEDEMLTESGFRESLAEERVLKGFAAAGAPSTTLATLVNRRLLRIEERLDARRVELTHDVLCPVVRASRDVRLEREARDEAERKLAAQRAREVATRKALVRARQIAAVCAVLAVGAAASAVFGFLSMKRAQEAELKAQQTREMAETARGESEKLVAYLLDDFYLELAPIGRLDIVGELAKRALHYYDALPTELRTPQTERNRALALVRYGSVLRTQARLDEGNKAADEAVKVLGQMRERGDDSEVTVIGLGLGYVTQARLASIANSDGEAVGFGERAVGVLKPVATAPTASVALRRAYGEALELLGDMQWRNGADAESVATFDEARTTLKGIDDLRMTDLTAAALYAEASAWQVNALARLGRSEDAKRAGKEGLAVAAQVLDKRPGHMQALRAQALVGTPLANIYKGEMQLAEALAMTETEIHGWKEFVRLDPGNTISWGNLLVGYQNENFILQQMGRPGDAAKTLWTSLEVERQSPPSRRVRQILGFNAALLSLLETNRGNAKQAADAFAAYGKFNDSLARDASPGFDEQLRTVAPEFWRAVLTQAAGDDRRALELGSAVAPKLDQVKPADEGQRRTKSFVLRVLHYAMAQSAYALKDYARAEREITLVQELRKQQPWNELSDKRDIAFEQAFAALVLARLDRQEDAQKLIAPVLKFERELSPRNRDDPAQHYELAAALYAASVAGLGNAPAQLAEAGALMDKLPPEMRALRDVTVWRERIAEERSRQRQS